MLKLFLIIATSISASASHAQDLNWRMVRITGEGRGAICNDSTVSALFNETLASFLYSSLGVNLPAGGFERLGEFGACNVRTRITIPQGMFITGLQQTITGGAIKSRGARGFFRSKIYLRTAPDENGKDRPVFLPIDRRADPDGLGMVAMAEKSFRPIEEDAGDILNLTNDVSFGPGKQAAMCQWTRAHGVTLDVIWRIGVMGQRANNTTAIIVQVDGADNEFKLGMNLQTCR